MQALGALADTEADELPAGRRRHHRQLRPAGASPGGAPRRPGPALPGAGARRGPPHRRPSLPGRRRHRDRVRRQLCRPAARARAGWSAPSRRGAERIDAALRARSSELGASLAVTAADESAVAALLDEVTALVEWPAVYVGRFEEHYLEVPQECLILTMRTNQKYFPLFDRPGQAAAALPDRLEHGRRRIRRPSSTATSGSSGRAWRMRASSSTRTARRAWRTGCRGWRRWSTTRASAARPNARGGSRRSAARSPRRSARIRRRSGAPRCSPRPTC